MWFITKISAGGEDIAYVRKFLFRCSLFACSSKAMSLGLEILTLLCTQDEQQVRIMQMTLAPELI